MYLQMITMAKKEFGNKNTENILRKIGNTNKHKKF